MEKIFILLIYLHYFLVEHVNSKFKFKGLSKGYQANIWSADDTMCLLIIHDTDGFFY